MGAPDLEAVVDAYRTKGLDAARQRLAAVMDDVMARPLDEQRASAASALPYVRHRPSSLGALFALFQGALIESGHDPRPLAEALDSLLLSAVGEARGLVDALRDAPTIAPDSDEAEQAIRIGGRLIPAEHAERLDEDRPSLVEAYFALDIWFRPAVAAWTRAPRVLDAARKRGQVAQALETVDGELEGVHWLRLLLGACGDEPYVLLFPELKAGYRLRMDGVADVGQLSVLLSDALPEPLARIGVAVADADSVRTMRGEGPQEGAGIYESGLRLFPWRAVDPATGLPEDGRFEWRAPGGTGTHSLPPDFQPRAVDEVQGHRVLIAVGPDAPGLSFTRVISATRTFEALQAALTDVEALTEAERARWSDAVARAGP